MFCNVDTALSLRPTPAKLRARALAAVLGVGGESAVMAAAEAERVAEAILGREVEGPAAGSGSDSVAGGRGALDAGTQAVVDWVSAGRWVDAARGEVMLGGNGAVRVWVTDEEGRT
jgi:hypothetical protein